MTTIHPPEDGKALLKSLRRRLELLERHHHPSIEQQLAEGQTRPKAPTDVTYAYVTVSDVPAVRTQWEPPTENIDDTPLTDLAGYEVENQVGGDLLYDDPDALTPLRPEQGLNGLHDPRGRTGIVRGSSGASVRLPGTTTVIPGAPGPTPDTYAPGVPESMTGPVGVQVEVPTHVWPAGGQVVHPSIAYIPGGLSGYTYWMAITPYPAGNDDHEDPNIVASNDGNTWVVPPGLTNPLDDKSGQPDYNSDPTLLWHGGKLHLWYRYYHPYATGQEEIIRYMSSSDGITWSAPVVAITNSHVVRRLLSPTVIYDNGQWVMWAVDLVPSTNRVVRLTAQNPQGPWSSPSICSFDQMPAGHEPWHLTVRKLGSTYVMLLNTRFTDPTQPNGAWLVWATSLNGYQWTGGLSSTIPMVKSSGTYLHDLLYQATFLPKASSPPSFDVWYSAMRKVPQTWDLFRTTTTGVAAPPPPPEPDTIITSESKDLWVWSDALVGSADGSGNASGDRVHNALSVSTQGALESSLYGASNLLAGVPLQLTGATSASDASFTVNGYASTRLTASAASVSAWFEVPAAAGERFALMAHHQSAAGQIGWEFRGAGGVLASAFQSVVAGRNAILTSPAPAQATAIRFYVFRATGQTSGQVVARFVKAGVMVSDHLSLSWRSTITQEQFTNVFTNPDGRTPSTGSYSQLVATNLSTNPSFLVNTTGLTGVNSATVARVVSASAFVGIAHAQVRRGANGNAEFFRVGTPTVTTGLVTARIRVRRGSPLLSEASTLTVTAQALNGGTVTASGAAQVVELTDEWKAVTVQVTVPAGSSTVRVSGSASGGAWSASDLVDVDGVEFYQGAAPLGYFDGSTTPTDGFTHAWTGTAGQSTSTKTATHVRRINHFRNPRLASATNVSAVAGATTSVTSGRVAVTTTAAGQGVRFTQQTAFPIGAVVSARVLVSGSGTVRMVINGTPVVQSEQVILGGSQERAVTLSVLLTGTSTLTVDVLATGAASFSVRDVLIEQGAAGPYFNGASAIPGRTAAWEGAVDASRSIEALPTPQSWSPVDATRERLAFDEEARLASAGMVDVAALKETSTLQARISSTGLTSGQATVAAAVVAPAGTTVQISATFSNAATATSEVFLPGEPVRHTFTIPAGATSSTFTFTFTGSFAALSKVRVGEVTLVQGAYSGPTFTGAMTATPGATAAWSGAADASTSVLTLSAADQSGGDGKPVSLVAATDLGLPPSHFLSPQDVFLVGSVLYVFYVGYSLAPSATSALGKVRTGKTYLASFEATGGRLGRFLGAQEWPAPSTGIWGTAVAADATWLYVYGVQGGSVQVARAPLANPMDVTYWTGAAWASSGTPAVVAVGADGFYGVRLIGSKWTALEVSAGGTQLSKWTADNPQGPFTSQGIQGTWTGLPRAYPRFHPQFDDPSQGIVISTTDSDGIRFQIGPPGTPSPSFDLEIWGDRQSVTDPEHYIFDIEPGTPFRVRVRAVTVDGRVSDWELGEPSVYTPVAPGIQVPAPPAVAIHFRGARVFVRNEDVTGEPFPGFLGFELHMSLQENFEPSTSTLIIERSEAPSLEYVWVPDYRTYYLGVVFKTVYGRSVMSETVAFNGERLSDPDLAGVLIDGAKIAKGTLNLESLTVGSFGNSLVANPGFEVLSQFDQSKPASWQAGHARQPGGGGLAPQDTGDFFVDESSPMEGARSLRIDTYATSSRQVISEPFPLVPGDIYYVALRLRSSILSGDIKVTVRMGETLEDLNVEPETATSVISPVFSTVGSFTPQLFEGQLEVPSILSGQPMYWGAVSIEALHVGTPYSTWVDAVQVRQIVGTAAIANASINNAKIANLAVDDSKISNLDAGKITSGFISGDRIEAGSLTVSQVGGLASSLAQKATTFAQDSVPTSLAIGDLWIDTNDGNKMYRAASVGADQVAVGEWQLLEQPAAQTTVTFVDPNPPISQHVGDLWFDSDNGNKMYRAASVGTTSIGTGYWEAVAASTTVTFAQNDPPTSVNIGDLWIDTNDNNRMYRASAAGSSVSWMSVEPGVVSTVTFAQDSIPTSLNEGDLWFDTDNGNKMYRAVAAGADQIAAGEWVLVESALTTTFAQATVPVALNAGDLWINTSGGGNKMYRAVVAGADAIAAGEWVLVAQPAAVTFLQNEPPVAQNIGDIWVDTNDGNRMYRAGSIGADQVAPGEWVLIDNTIFQEAATIVDGWRFTGTTEINGGKIKTDTIEAGALKIGVIRSNLVPDGSLEETYAFMPWDPFGQWAGVGGTFGDVTRWRRGSAAYGSTIARDTTGAYARSGNGAVLLTTSAHAQSEVALISPSIPLQVGKTYRVTLNALSVGGQALLVVQSSSNSSPNISGFEGSQTLASDEYTGWVHPPVVQAPTADAPIDKRLFKRYAWTFTATNTWMMLRLMNFRPLVASTLVLDDIAIVEVGIGGAVEVGPHGIRLFDNEGFEASSWVTNRPSRFAIATEDVEVAAIDEDGNISGQDGSFAGRLSTLGKPLLGELEAFVPAGAENMGEAWLDMMPRGLVGHAQRPLGALNSGTSTKPLFEVMWKAEPGRSYEIVFGGLLGTLQNVDRHAGFILRNGTPAYTADATGVAADPAGAGTTLAHSYAARSATNDEYQTFPARVVTVRCNREGLPKGEVNPGYNRLLLIHSPGNSGILTPVSPDHIATITVKDIGPDAPEDSVLNGGGGGIVTKKNYSSVWVANSSRVYNSNGGVATGSGGGTLYDLVNGPVPGTNNNRHSLALFTGGAVSGENGKTMASALAGATIHKVEVYLYARHWYYNSGGTAYIRSYTSGTTLPATLAAPGGTPATKGSWKKGTGMWVDVTAATNMKSTSLRGIIVGATGTTNLLTYGRFDGATQQRKPQLRVSYSR